MTDPHTTDRYTPRPYWHVDAKWLIGLLAVPTISLWLFGFGLYRLTDAQRAPAFVRALIASVINQPGSDAHINSEQLNRQLTPLYDHGSAGVATALQMSSSGQTAVAKQLQVLDLFTRNTHTKLGWALAGLAIVALLLTAVAVYFSHRFGRLVTPGVVLIAASGLGAAVFLTLSSGTDTSGVKIATLGPAVLHLAGAAFLSAYLGCLIAGLALVLLAAILAPIYRSRKALH